MASPKRARLSLGASASGGRLTSPTSPNAGGFGGGFGGAKVLRKTAGKQWPYAPRSARFRLTEVRELCGSTPAQFAQSVSNLLTGDAPPISQQQLLAMETGFALVPAQVFASVERLYEDRQAELARQLAAQEPPVLEGGVYPYQEPMEGIDYQIAPPRYLGAVGSAKAMSRENRKDETVFSPRSALAAGVRVDDYLARARDLFGQYEPPQREPPPPHAAAGAVGGRGGGSVDGGAAEADGSGAEAGAAKPTAAAAAATGWSAQEGRLQESEEVALAVLHDLKYNVEAALAALQLCLEWHQPTRSGEPRVAAVASSDGSDASRAAAANSIIWLQRLSEHARRRSWSVGEVEALDAGIKDHGKELAVLHQHVLVEKSLPQLIEMYYVTGWRHQSP